MPELITIEKLEPVAWHIGVGKYVIDFDQEDGETGIYWVIWERVPKLKRCANYVASSLEDAVRDANAALKKLMPKEGEDA